MTLAEWPTQTSLLKSSYLRRIGFWPFPRRAQGCPQPLSELEDDMDNLVSCIRAVSAGFAVSMTLASAAIAQTSEPWAPPAPPVRAARPVPGAPPAPPLAP